MATIKTLLGNVKGKDGRGCEEVVLYSGTCSACISSNVATSTSPMIEMSESIENYSSIRIEFQYYDGISSGEGIASTSRTFSTEYIKKVYTHSSLVSTTTYGNVSAAQIFGFYDATHLVLMWELYTGIAHNVSYITVTGIKNTMSDDKETGMSSNKYSTTEEVVGTWIDGKTIYRKVVSCGTLPDKTDKTVAHGISNFGHIINISGYCEDINGSYPLPLSYNALNGDGCVGVWADKTNITISCPTAYYPNVTASYVILEYTKTT